MRKLDVARSVRYIFGDDRSTFMKLDIAIMSIYLSSKKWGVFFGCRYKKSNLSFWCNNLKSKYWYNFRYPKLVPRTHMFYGMMKCRKHFTSYEYSFFIGSIDRYLVRDDGRCATQKKKKVIKIEIRDISYQNFLEFPNNSLCHFRFSPYTSEYVMQ